jgi:hypothetical protein
MPAQHSPASPRRFSRTKWAAVFTYVYDIVVVSKNKEDHLSDLSETLAKMHEARFRLNPEKCIFGVCQGKILDYLVSHMGIEANPKKIQAIMDMAPP